MRIEFRRLLHQKYDVNWFFFKFGLKPGQDLLQIDLKFFLQDLYQKIAWRFERARQVRCRGYFENNGRLVDKSLYLEDIPRTLLLQKR